MSEHDFWLSSIGKGLGLIGSLTLLVIALNVVVNFFDWCRRTSNRKKWAQEKIDSLAARYPELEERLSKLEARFFERAVMCREHDLKIHYLESYFSDKKEDPKQ